jgi:hypothetical protein
MSDNVFSWAKIELVDGVMNKIFRNLLAPIYNPPRQITPRKVSVLVKITFSTNETNENKYKLFS